MDREAGRTKRQLSQTQRDLAECQQELASIDQAHVANESGRDNFVAIGHTTLFAASIAFVSDLASAGNPMATWLLVGGWGVGVIGMLALSASFYLARRHLDMRRENVYAVEISEPKSTGVFNNIALLSFPISLIAIFIFAALNV